MTPRIVSLIPSATDILATLGLVPWMVGRSHECDRPPEVLALPVCTAPTFATGGTSRDIHDRVTDLLQQALAIYELHLDVLRQVAPTHILTQDRCAVCAVDQATVERAACEVLKADISVISLTPATLADVAGDIDRVGAAFGRNGAAAAAAFSDRIAAVSAEVAEAAENTRPRVACLEWTDPLIIGGHWVPELVEAAGGRDVFGTVGAPARQIEWSALIAADPDVIVAMPCGYDLERTHADAEALIATPEARRLRAVADDQVFAVDANRYFSRPGPGLAESAEVLAEILHPGRAPFGHAGHGWRKVARA